MTTSTHTHTHTHTHKHAQGCDAMTWLSSRLHSMVARAGTEPARARMRVVSTLLTGVGPEALDHGYGALRRLLVPGLGLGRRRLGAHRLPSAAGCGSPWAAAARATARGVLGGRRLVQGTRYTDSLRYRAKRRPRSRAAPGETGVPCRQCTRPLKGRGNASACTRSRTCTRGSSTCRSQGVPADR